jgi:hypothetical protein
MATTLPQAFLKLKENLEITGLQTSTVSTRQQNVRAVIQAGLLVREDFLTGSYSRSTMIAPLGQADIDVLVVLDTQYFHRFNHQNGNPAGLLDLVKRTLRQTYTHTPDISRNGQAVTIRFDDFAVDVVPAFYREGGGYLIPNSARSTWISTDPKRHVEIAAAANKVHAGNFVPLVKMIKGWNRAHGQYFNSFHLEVLALQIFNGVAISNFSSGVRYYFDKARALVTQQNPDPAGYGGDVGAYITASMVPEASGLFQRAYDQARNAESFEQQGRVQLAIDGWARIFGEYFPAYG